MQHLSGLDTLFLSLEIGHGSIHIGTVTLLDTSTSGDGFSFDRFRDLLASRLHLARTFRQRLVHVPLDLGHPYWIEDPDFDLSNHMMHLALPAPGGEAELMDLAGDFFAEPLDHDRPLWKFAVVDGVDSLPDLPAPAKNLGSALEPSIVTDLPEITHEVSIVTNEVARVDEPSVISEIDDDEPSGPVRSRVDTDAVTALA